MKSATQYFSRVLLVSCILGSPPASAADLPEASLGEVSQAASDPTSGITLLFFENQTTYLDGDPVDSRPTNSTSFQPVFAVPLAEGAWNIIARPSVRYTSSPFSDELTNPFGRTEGLGDSSLFVLAAPSQKKVILAVWFGG